MILQVERLTKRYGPVQAVRDITFGVEPGEVFALLGPNGSGKTTTLKCIVGLNIPTSGTITIGGIDALADPIGARRQISFLPQRVVFPETLTAREVLHFHACLRGLPSAAIEDGLRAASFNGAADRRVGTFSGGMVQRLGLAVAAMPTAPVLLLDEPTASLDPEGVIRFREFVRDQRARGTTVVFSTHLLTEVEQLADRVAVFVGGRIVVCTDISEIRRTFLANGTVEDMYLHYVGGAHDAP